MALASALSLRRANSLRTHDISCALKYRSRRFLPEISATTDRGRIDGTARAAHPDDRGGSTTSAPRPPSGWYPPTVFLDFRRGAGVVCPRATAFRRDPRYFGGDARVLYARTFSSAIFALPLPTANAASAMSTHDHLLHFGARKLRDVASGHDNYLLAQCALLEQVQDAPT